MNRPRHTTPARSAALPGLSRAAVARNLGISETQVARIEARALLKARAEFERRGMNFRAILSILTATTEP